VFQPTSGGGASTRLGKGATVTTQPGVVAKDGQEAPTVGGPDTSRPRNRRSWPTGPPWLQSDVLVVGDRVVARPRANDRPAVKHPQTAITQLLPKDLLCRGSGDPHPGVAPDVGERLDIKLHGWAANLRYPVSYLSVIIP
jgi:hypothetical protein